MSYTDSGQTVDEVVCLVYSQLLGRLLLHFHFWAASVDRVSWVGFQKDSGVDGTRRQAVVYSGHCPLLARRRNSFKGTLFNTVIVVYGLALANQT